MKIIWEEYIYKNTDKNKLLYKYIYIRNNSIKLNNKKYLKFLINSYGGFT